MKRHTLILTVSAAVLTLLAVSGCTGGSNSSSSTGSVPAIGGAGMGSAPDAAAGSAGSGVAGSRVAGSGVAGTGSVVIPDQQVVTTGSMTLVADHPIDVADRAATLVESAGGHVDNRTEQTGDSSGPGIAYPIDGGDGVVPGPSVGCAGGDCGSGGSPGSATDSSLGSSPGAVTLPVPALPGENATLVLRIPSDRMLPTVEALKALATVQTMSLTSTDVTTEAADVSARVTALQTSVDRLLTLVSTATTTSDLISLEDALASRQADLDSLKAQRDALSDQTQYASVTLSVLGHEAVATAGPTDFWGGLAAGWSSMITAAGTGFIALGFALPWLVVLAVVAAVVLAGIRLSRRRSRSISHDA